MLQNHVEIIKAREHFNNRTKNCQLKQDNAGWGQCLTAKGGGRAHRRWQFSPPSFVPPLQSVVFV